MVNLGTVQIVGAGPGDPDLITVAGLRALQQADIIFYDRLASSNLLNEAKRAKHVYVGKEPGHHAWTQADINACLIEQARLGKSVVRLKGGDPFVFGRGGEECQALAAAGISFKVIPGISSALSAPAYAGIPVTQRGVATSFTVVTGHTAGTDQCAIAWDRLPDQGTLVILMGVRNLPTIANQLVQHGRDATTPVAVVQQATTAEQQAVFGTLADIAERAQHITSPAVIVVGEVVRLAQEIEWYEPEAVPFTLDFLALESLQPALAFEWRQSS